MRNYPPSSGSKRGRRKGAVQPPDRPGRLLAQAREAVFEGRPDEAMELCERALATMPRVLELLLIRAAGLLDQGYASLALSYLDTAVDLDPDHGDAQVERARALIDLGRVGEARDDLKELREAWPDDPEILHLLATCEDLLGANGRADRLYRAAARLDPTAYPEPVRLHATALVASARRALQELPEDVRARLRDVDIQVMDVPAPELLEGEAGSDPLPPTLLGLFMGATLTEQGSTEVIAPLPTRIFVFQRNIERLVRSEEELHDQIRITVWHEVGHFLGLDEDDMHARGLD